MQLPWFGCSVDSGGPAMPWICTPLRSGWNIWMNGNFFIFQCYVQMTTFLGECVQNVLQNETLMDSIVFLSNIIPYQEIVSNLQMNDTQEIFMTLNSCFLIRMIRFTCFMIFALIFRGRLVSAGFTPPHILKMSPHWPILSSLTQEPLRNI